MENKALQLILAEGEGYKIEFKERLSNLDREIVAFANAAGGSIYLGVNDAGEVIGIQVTNSLKSQIVDIARNCDPSIKIDLVPHKVEKIVEIKVQEGTDKPYKCSDGFFLIGPNSQKLKRDEIINFINNVGKVHFDEALNDKFHYPRDFLEKSLKEFLAISGIKTQLPNKDVLISLNVLEAKQVHPSFTNTGVLFFAKSPQKFFPEAYITAVRYQSQDRFSIIDKKDFKGSLIHQIEEVMEFLLRHMSVVADISKSFTVRHDIYDYPPVALREAVVNAVTHRDYFYDGSHIYIHMFPTHIDIENPGGLYHGLTLEDLGKRSIRRNRLIADLLHRAKYIERVGSGFDRMKHVLAENNNPPLEVSATNFFNIRFDKRIPQVDVTLLTERQIQLHNLFQQGGQLTKKNVAMLLHVSEDTALRDLKVLLQLGIIIKSGTGKSTVYHINL